uniref:Uncharacterized protein n=1 Tax=Triticum urartu TaxID=4572 RepID=A0A8R7UM07_TRIUA
MHVHYCPLARIGQKATSALANSSLFCVISATISPNLHGGLTTGTVERADCPPTAGPLRSPLTCTSLDFCAMMTEFTTSSSGWHTANTLNPPRVMSWGSTIGYRNPRAPCALRTTRAAPSAMCVPRCAITLALSSAAMPTSAARKTTSYLASSPARSATSAVWNDMRAPMSLSARNSLLARSLAAPHRS